MYSSGLLFLTVKGRALAMLNFQHPIDGSQSPTTPAPGDRIPSRGQEEQLQSHLQDHICIHKLKNKNKSFFIFTNY